MRILALETSGRLASIALLIGQGEQTEPIRSFQLEPSQRTAQALAPAMQELLAEADWSPSDVGLVAVTIGPGSFTGLRIGVTAAKMFAYAVGAEVVAIDTLDLLANQATQTSGKLWTILDAQRDELFVAEFEFMSHKGPQRLGPNYILPCSEWLSQLNPNDRVTGPILLRLGEQLPDSVHSVSESLWHPQATSLGQLAWQNYQLGKLDDLWQLVPVYGRLSAAEEKLRSK